MSMNPTLFALISPDHPGGRTQWKRGLETQFPNCVQAGVEQQQLQEIRKMGKDEQEERRMETSASH